MKFASIYIRGLICLLQLFFLLPSCRSRDTSAGEEGATGVLADSVRAALKNYDTAYRQSASFILKNMGAHYFTQGEKEETYANMIEQYSRSADTLEKILHNLKDMHFADSREVYDKDFLSAGYVTSDILLAHNIFNKTAWKNQVSRENFYNYVLSYRIYKEALDKEGWRKYYLENYTREKGDSIFALSLDSAIATLHHWLRERKKHFKLKFGSYGFNLPPLPVTENNDLPLGTCDELACLSTAQLRALGIPAAMDFVPNYANVNSGHSWSAAILSDNSCMPFDIANDTLGRFKARGFIIAKVFRQAFAPDKTNPFYELPSNSSLPECFSNPYLKDVTRMYTETSEVSVPLPFENHDDKATKVYMAVFSRPEWTPVDVGEIKNGKAYFHNLGRGGVYLPVTIDAGNKKQPVGYAFQLLPNGNLRYYTPDTTQLQEITLYRKYPTSLGRDNDMYIRRAIGGSFQGANRKDFKDSFTLFTIHSYASDTFNVANFRSPKSFRYVRYLSGKNSYGNMAEVEFYTGTQSDSLLKGEVIGTEGSYMDKASLSKKALFDGDLLTYFDSKQADFSWAGLKLDKSVPISRIRFLARNDLNGIVKGDTYELFYWSNEWKSLGRVIAQKNYLVYKNVPRNTILWLRNLSAGREERIFTYENGKQVWW